MARRAGIVIVAISLLSNGVSEFSMEIDDVVSSPASQTRITIDRVADLSLRAKNRTIDLLCNNVDDCLPTSLCAAGSTCVDRIAGYRCACPPGVSGVTCANVCRQRADVVLALDVSGSIGDYTQSYDEFVRSLVLRLNADSRVGYLVFSDAANIQFQVGYSSSVYFIQGYRHGMDWDEPTAVLPERGWLIGQGLTPLLTQFKSYRDLQ